MPRSKNNKRITVRFKGNEFYFRQNDLKILEIIYNEDQYFTAEKLQMWMLKKKIDLSESKIRITIKKFLMLGFIRNANNIMKKDLAPKYGIQVHPDIKAVKQSDKFSRIVIGKTGRTKYYRITYEGLDIGDRIFNNQQQLIMQW